MLGEARKHLTASQNAALNHVIDSRSPVILIMGPPGTGKTYFIIWLERILHAAGIKFLCAAPSNTAVDNIATNFENAAPEMGLIRFHAYFGETGSIRRHGNVMRNENEQKVFPAQQTKEEPPKSEEDAELDNAWLTVLQHLQRKKSAWKAKEKQRPNYKTMGLGTRSMQNAGLIEHQVPHFQHPQNNPHQRLVKMLDDGDAFQPEAEKAKYIYKI